jgi:hypothetical protein
LAFLLRGNFFINKKPVYLSVTVRIAPLPAGRESYLSRKINTASGRDFIKLHWIQAI